MKQWLATCLILPALSTLASANEPAHTEVKPIKAPEAAKPVSTPMKNAPPTQVDNLKTLKDIKPKADAAEGKSAEKATESKSEAKHGEVKAEMKSDAKAETKPVEPPVVQYVPPRYSSYRPVVPSKSPAARHYSSAAHAKPKVAQDVAVVPGLVRVMPGSTLPAGKVLPPAKGLATSNTTMTAATGAVAAKPRLSWGETSVVKTAAEPAPEIYIVKDPELRWQQYSYP